MVVLHLCIFNRRGVDIFSLRLRSVVLKVNAGRNGTLVPYLLGGKGRVTRWVPVNMPTADGLELLPPGGFLQLVQCIAFLPPWTLFVRVCFRVCSCAQRAVGLPAVCASSFESLGLAALTVCTLGFPPRWATLMLVAASHGLCCTGFSSRSPWPHAGQTSASGPLPCTQWQCGARSELTLVGVHIAQAQSGLHTWTALWRIPSTTSGRLTETDTAGTNSEHACVNEPSVWRVASQPQQAKRGH